MTDSPDEPEPIPQDEAKRLWSLMKQNEPLSQTDQALVRQAVDWQMWKRHGIVRKPSSAKQSDSSGTSDTRREKLAVS